MTNQYQELATKYLSNAPRKEINEQEKESLIAWVQSRYNSIVKPTTGTLPIEKISLNLSLSDASSFICGGHSKYQHINEPTQLLLHSKIEERVRDGYSFGDLLEQDDQVSVNLFYSQTTRPYANLYRAIMCKPDSMIEEDNKTLEQRVTDYLQMKAQAEYDQYINPENIKNYVTQELERIRLEEQQKQETEALQAMQTAIEAATNPVVLQMQSMPSEVAFSDVEAMFEDVKDPAKLAEYLKLAGYTKTTKSVGGSRKTLWIKEGQLCQ